MSDEMDTPFYGVNALKVVVLPKLFTKGVSTMKLRTIGIDLAKNVFQVCGVNEHMKPQFNKKLKRNELLDFMRQQPPTMVVMEACYSSHYWGREMAK